MIAKVDRRGVAQTESHHAPKSNFGSLGGKEAMKNEPLQLFRRKQFIFLAVEVRDVAYLAFLPPL